MKFPGNIGEIFQQAQKIQETVSKVQAELETKEVSGSAGGGMVTITISGSMHVTKVSIEPSLIESKDQEMLQDLIKAAANDAVRKAKDLLKAEMSKVTGGIPIPGFS